MRTQQCVALHTQHTPHPAAGHQGPDDEVGLDQHPVHHELGQMHAAWPKRSVERAVGPHRHYHSRCGAEPGEVLHRLRDDLGRREAPVEDATQQPARQDVTIEYKKPFQAAPLMKKVDTRSPGHIQLAEEALALRVGGVGKAVALEVPVPLQHSYTVTC